MDERAEKYRKSEVLHNKHSGSTIILAGTAPSLQKVPCKQLAGQIVMGCNGILRTPGFDPSVFSQFYLMIADRRVYLREHMLAEKASERFPVLLSTTIWDSKVKCGGAIAPPRPTWAYYPWRVGTCRTDFNWTTFTWPLCSCASIIGPMIQAAVIMGAKQIGVIGIDMQMPAAGSMHSYDDGGAGKREATVHEQNKLGVPITHQLLAKAQRRVREMGINAENISPVRRTAFANLWGHHDMDRFLKG